jgi:hypothetical protein
MLQYLKVVTLKIFKMYTIIEQSTNKVLFAKFDNQVIEGQIAIDKVCTIETESEIFYNFETQEFYTK